MDNNNNSENWVPLQKTQSAGTSTVADDNWVKVDTDNQDKTAYDRFKAQPSGAQATDQELIDRGEGDYASDRAKTSKTGQPMAKDVSGSETGSKGPTEASGRPSKGVSGSWTSDPEVKEGISPTGKRYNTIIGPKEAPDEGFLNAGIHTAEGAAWSMVAKPLAGTAISKEDSADMDRYLGDLEYQHPIAATIAGTAPYIATAVLFPESLLPNVWGRMAVQFGTVSMFNAIGLERVDEADKTLAQKALTVGEETAKGAAYSPIFAAAHGITFVERPFATALARAGVIAGGSGVMSTFFGDNITQAFKQGGLLGAFSLITEAFYLSNTVIGRGVLSHINNIRAEYAVKAGLPEPAALDPKSPDFQEQAVKAKEELSKKVPGADKPQIVAATIRPISSVKVDLMDLGPIHGIGGEGKIGLNVKLGKEQNKLAAKHELGHVIDDHFKIRDNSEVIAEFKMEEDVKGEEVNRKEAIAEAVNQIILGNKDVIAKHPALVKFLNENVKDLSALIKDIDAKIDKLWEHPELVPRAQEPKSWQLQAEIHGTSHEDALEKIGKKKAPEAVEGKESAFIDNVAKLTAENKLASTEDADRYGESIKGNPEKIKELHKLHDESKAKSKEMMARFDSLTPQEEKELNEISVKTQLYREAYEAAEKKSPEEIKQAEFLKNSVDVANILDWEHNQQAGGVFTTGGKQTGPEREVYSSKTGHSEAMQKAAKRNGSYEKVFELLNRYLDGGKLTDLQTKDVESIIADYRENVKKGFENILKGIEDAKKELTESETNEVIDTFKKEAGLSDALWQDQENAATEHTPSGQLRHELQAPIPGDLFQEKGELFEEGKDYQAGFTVLNPDGTTKFIDREESKKAPYNLPNGASEDVKGLNESKFAKPTEEPKITNPDTLKMIKNQDGKMEARMIPFQAEIAENLATAYAEMKNTFVPPDVSDPSKFTAQSMRQWLGLQARNMDRFNNSMKRAEKIFDKMKMADIIDQHTRAEHGEAQDTPEMQKIWDILQEVNHNKAMEIQRETGKLQHLIDNYLPRFWEDPKKAMNILSRLWSRRPFAGSKAFLKHRSIDDFETGIKAGLTPVSWNPVTLTMLKLKEMDKFLTAYRTMQGGKETGYDVYVPIGGNAPEGWVKIDDSISQVVKSPMIPIQESYDDQIMGGLQKVADSLGLDTERKPRIGGKRLGYAQKGPIDQATGMPGPGKVVTKFATPEDVFAHEIGHQIDYMYGMKEKMFGGSRPKADFILDRMIGKAEREGRTDDVKRMQDQKEINKELRTLADATEGPEYWRRKSTEKMAIMLGSLIHAPEEFKRLAPKSYKMFTDILKSDPKLAPLLDIKPSVKLHAVHGDEVYAGGMVIAGHFYSHPDRARIINNYLSPGLRGNYAYDLYRTAGNTLIQARLSLSAFHAQFISNDANIANFSLGLNKLATGDVKGFLKTAPQSLLYVKAPWDTLMEGRKVNKAWHGADVDPMTNMISDLYARAGGRAKMDKFYAIEADKAMAKAVKEGKYMTGVLHTPFWLLQQTMRPLMEYYVPRMKMGVFANLMKWEIERNPNMTNEELLTKANKAQDTVDDRMGQLVYDNIFINRALKDAGMASVQSLGWDIGDVRLFGGGTVDLVKALNDLRQGKGTDLSYRLSYVISMPIIMGFYGAVFQYLHTGLLPGQGHEDQGAGGILKDLYFPRIGGYDPNGNESRVSPASYVKDIYHFVEAPLITALDKLNPLPNEIIDLLRNKDFYGVQIYNPDDKFVQQTIDKLNYAVQSNLPYSIQIAERRPKKGIGSTIESFLGMNIAPYDVNMTSAEKLAHNMAMTHISPAARTPEEAQHSKAKGKVYSDYLADRDPQVLDAAMYEGTINLKEKKAMLKEGNMTNLERLTKNLSYDEVFHVLNKGKPNADEKEELKKILDKKKANKEKAGRWTDREEELYARSSKLEE